MKTRMGNVLDIAGDIAFERAAPGWNGGEMARANEQLVVVFQK